MRQYLLTVESSNRIDTQFHILPRVPLQSLVPKLMIPRKGDKLELCLPDGHSEDAIISSFGVEMWKGSDGVLYTTSDPSAPSLTLSITSDLPFEEIPSGTEIWLRDAQFAS